MHAQHNHNGQDKILTPDPFRIKTHPTGTRSTPERNPDEITKLRTSLEENAHHLARLFGLKEREKRVLTDLASEEMGVVSDHPPAVTSHPELLSLLSPTAPLVKYGLVEMETARPAPLPSLPEKVKNQMLGITDLDRWLTTYVQELPAPSSLPPAWESLAHTMGAMMAQNSREHRILELNGPHPADLYALACAVSEKAQLPAYRLRTGHILPNPLMESTFLRLWNRDARIRPMIALFEITGHETPARRFHALQFLDSLESPVLLLSATPTEGAGGRITRFSLPELTFTEQDLLWEKYLGEEGVADGREEEIRNLTNHFRLQPHQIEQVAAQALASGESGAPGQDADSVTGEMWNQARILSRPRIHDLAHLIEPALSLEDLVLPEESREKLKEIIQRIRHTRQIFQEWGFQSKSPRGLGTTALFFGPSGTGKTHAAEALAGELHLDLYRIDLSRVVSKYIGETEKNLSRIYDEAKNSGAVLLFDEADALFGKRTETKDAHDRYANQEIAFLLQKMEEYRGLSILTTNLKNNMDDAFKRRITYRVKFKLPDTETRKAIWKRIYSETTPLHNLNYDELATLELTGAEIKTMALRAAYLAAAQKDPVKMKYIYHTLKEELLKVDLVLTPGEFRHWLNDAMN